MSSLKKLRRKGKFSWFILAPLFLFIIYCVIPTKYFIDVAAGSYFLHHPSSYSAYKREKAQRMALIKAMKEKSRLEIASEHIVKMSFNKAMDIGKPFTLPTSNAPQLQASGLLGAKIIPDHSIVSYKNYAVCRYFRVELSRQQMKLHHIKVIDPHGVTCLLTTHHSWKFVVLPKLKVTS